MTFTNPTMEKPCCWLAWRSETTLATLMADRVVPAWIGRQAARSGRSRAGLGSPGSCRSHGAYSLSSIDARPCVSSNRLAADQQVSRRSPCTRTHPSLGGHDGPVDSSTGLRVGCAGQVTGKPRLACVPKREASLSIRQRPRQSREKRIVIDLEAFGIAGFRTRTEHHGYQPPARVDVDELPVDPFGLEASFQLWVVENRDPPHVSVGNDRPVDLERRTGLGDPTVR